MRLYGLAELAEATGYPIGLLRTWRDRGKLPPATFTLKAGQFWQGREIESWLAEHHRDKNRRAALERRR